jgi:hypothetical protein
MAGSCECGDEHSDSIKCGDFFTSWGPVSFSTRTLLHGVSTGFFFTCLSTVPVGGVWVGQQRIKQVHMLEVNCWLNTVDRIFFKRFATIGLANAVITSFSETPLAIRSFSKINPCVISGFRRNVNKVLSSGMLLSVDWWLVTDVSGQPIGPPFNGQADWLILEEGTYRLSRNVCN